MTVHSASPRFGQIVGLEKIYVKKVPGRDLKEMERNFEKHLDNFSCSVEPGQGVNSIVELDSKKREAVIYRFFSDSPGNEPALEQAAHNKKIESVQDLYQHFSRQVKNKSESTVNFYPNSQQSAISKNSISRLSALKNFLFHYYSNFPLFRTQLPTK
jgi:hypothetical protein